jgi:hypothetical protein
MHTNGTITIELNGTMIISHHETEGQTNWRNIVCI